MNNSVYRFALDLHTSQSQVSIPVKLYETGRQLHIYLSDGDKPYFIKDDCLAKISIKRPTGTHLAEFCNIERNTVIVYDFAQNANTAAMEGIHECDVTLYGVDGRVLGSPRFTMIVSERVIRSDEIELTDKDYTAIDAMLAQENERKNKEDERIAKENERIAKENERKSNEDERIAKDSGRDAAINNAVEKSEQALEMSNAATTTVEEFREEIGSEALIEDKPTIKGAVNYAVSTARDAANQAGVVRTNLINLSAQVHGIGRSYVVPDFSYFIAFLDSKRLIELKEDRDGDGVPESYYIFVSDLKTGDNIIITEVGVPDFWFEKNSALEEFDTYPYNGTEYTLYAKANGAVIGGAHILETDYTVIEGFSASATASANNAANYARQALTSEINAKESEEAAQAAKDATEEFFNRLGIVQTLGNSEDKIMSQKAVTDELVERTEIDAHFEDISDTLTIEFGYYYSKLKKKDVGSDKEACCGLIPVKEGDRFKITSAYGYYRVFIAEFNETQEFISYTGQVDDFVVVTDYEYTVPSGVHYIGINNNSQGSRPMVVLKLSRRPIKEQVEKNTNDIAKLNEGQKATTEAIKNATEYDGLRDKNITDTLTLEYNAWYGKNLVKASNQPDVMCCTNLIPVAEGDVFKITATYGYYTVLIAEFDGSGAFESYVGEAEADTAVTDFEYTVPGGVSYIAISNRNQKYNPLKVIRLVPEDVKNRIEKNTQDIASNKQSIVKAFDDGKSKAEKSFVYDYSTAIGLVIDLLKKGTYNEDVSRTIEALENSVYPNGIKLANSLAEGTYTLKYEYVYKKDGEDVAGVFTDWLDICTFTITSSEQRLVYREFIAENAPPKTATQIGVYAENGARVGKIDLGWLNRFMSQWNLNYSFAVISDVHIGKGDSDEDLRNATAYFDRQDGKDGRDNIEFAVICGDAVDNGKDTAELSKYQSIVADVKTPIYVAMGNHESVNLDVSGAGTDISGNYASISQYFKQNLHPTINQELYYSFNKGNDVFIILGVYGNFNYGRTFSTAELQWLYETLEANRNKRCFLFHHYFPKNGSGDAVNCYSSDGLKGTQGEVFYNLLRHYKNVIYFHGHSHASFRVQELNKYNTIDKEYGHYSVHVPSLMWTTYPNANGDAYVKDQETGEGYIVEVYSTGVLLKGRDFEKNMFVPLGTYFLETTIQEVKENTFFDETGTIITEK